jgi:hypothetical protein
MFLLSRLAWLPINIALTNLFTDLSTDDKDRQIVVQWILGVLAIVAVVGLLGTAHFLILWVPYTDTKRYWASLREMGEGTGAGTQMLPERNDWSDNTSRLVPRFFAFEHFK